MPVEGNAMVFNLVLQQKFSRQVAPALTYTQDSEEPPSNCLLAIKWGDGEAANQQNTILLFCSSGLWHYLHSEISILTELWQGST